MDFSDLTMGGFVAQRWAVERLEAEAAASGVQGLRETGTRTPEVLLGPGTYCEESQGLGSNYADAKQGQTGLRN